MTRRPAFEKAGPLPLNRHFASVEVETPPRYSPAAGGRSHFERLGECSRLMIAISSFRKRQ